jgi:polysaccharide export outer membrane protein
MKQISFRVQYLWTYLFTVFIFLSSCAYHSAPPPGTIKSIELSDVSPVVASEKVTIENGLFSESPPSDYLVGPGDIISVAIYGYPSQPTDGRSELQPGGTTKGSRVDSAGSIQVPRVGSVQVAGRSLQQIRDLLQDSFKKYLKNPSVVVEILEYKSHPLYLLGQFNAPGTHYMDRPINLLQGLALGRGLNPTANLRGARLLRGNKIAPVDIYSLLLDGDQRQNIWLSPGDTIYLPDNTLQNVFVFGAVRNPGPIPMKNGQIYLHQAVAAAGGLGDTGYDNNIRIIRSISPTRGELIVVDLEKILNGETRPFSLSDGDIVYVPKNWVGNWNQAINELLPTLQLFGAVINPFVQIKYLSR